MWYQLPRNPGGLSNSILLFTTKFVLKNSSDSILLNWAFESHHSLTWLIYKKIIKRHKNECYIIANQENNYDKTFSLKIFSFKRCVSYQQTIELLFC